VTHWLEQGDLFPRASQAQSAPENDNGKRPALIKALPTVKLRRGRYQDVYESDYQTDALIVDAPYSSRTHKGHDDGLAAVNRFRPEDEKRKRVDNRTGAVYAVGVHRRKAINFGAWTPDDVRDFVGFWAPRTRGWFVTMTDHVLAPHWEAALEASGRYVFSPITYMEPGGRVRTTGDGPAQWSCFIVAARPKTKAAMKWRALPGGYVLPPEQNDRKADDLSVVGGKSLWIMRSLVRDYSNAGDLVTDPCCGAGTTLLAALMADRSADGAEALDAHADKAIERLRRGYTRPLF